MEIVDCYVKCNASFRIIDCNYKFECLSRMTREYLYSRYLFDCFFKKEWKTISRSLNNSNRLSRSVFKYRVPLSKITVKSYISCEHLDGNYIFHITPVSLSVPDKIRMRKSALTRINSGNSMEVHTLDMGAHVYKYTVETLG